jgi:hypothetical protein
MFIIPFIGKRTTNNNMIVTSFSIFTVGGTQLWQESDTFTVSEILGANDIFVSDPPIFKNGAYFCKVDTKKTNMADFYKWEEIAPESDETFCWRTFYLFGSTQDHSSWLPLQDKRLGHYTYQELFDAMSAFI